MYTSHRLSQFEAAGARYAIIGDTASEDPDYETIESVLYWIADLRQDPEDESTTVLDVMRRRQAEEATRAASV